jgi:hypothetical protein
MRPFLCAVLTVVLAVSLVPAETNAQQGDAPAKVQSQSKAKKAIASKSKTEPGMKTCNYKFPDGERRTWNCRKEEPCCAWDQIKYVKCGSTVTNCL